MQRPLVIVRATLAVVFAFACASGCSSTGDGTSAPVDAGVAGSGAGGRGGAAGDIGLTPMAGKSGAAGQSAAGYGGNGGTLGGAGAGTDGGVAPTIDAASTAACPAAPPTAGTPCSGGLACSYGEAPRPSCRTQALCTAGSWKVTPPSAAAVCGTQPSACPATAMPNAACSTANVTCQYADAACSCTQIGGALKWLCDSENTRDAACPARLPNQGTACAAKPAPFACRYGGCMVSGEWMSASCPAGTWVWSRLACTGKAEACNGSPSGTCDPATATACRRADGATCTCTRPCGGVAPGPEDPRYWRCEPAPPLGCPESVPNKGAACDQEGTTCVYGTCGGSTATCTSGKWNVKDLPLPPSTSEPCTTESCGPAPGAPSQRCADGSFAGPVCKRTEAGTCGWFITTCADAGTK